MTQNTSIILFATGILLMPSPAIAREHTKKSNARLWFEYAYTIEEQAPARAVLMYEWALEAGLADQKKTKGMGRTALWRLFYLYQKQEAYLEAAQLLVELRKQARGKGAKKQLQHLQERLWMTIRAKWKLDQTISAFLLKGLKNLKSQTEDANWYFIQALQSNPQSQSLRKMVLTLLVKENKGSLALELLDRAAADTPDILKQADYLLDYAALLQQQGAFYEAEDTLLKLLTNEAREDLQTSQQMRFYYLMGHIYRGLKRYPQAARHFQTAATFAHKERMNGLAAYCLYLHRELSQAFTLMAQHKPKEHTDGYILWLVLKIKLNKNAARARKRLQKLRSYLQAKDKQTDSVLARRALALTF